MNEWTLPPISNLELTGVVIVAILTLCVSLWMGAVVAERLLPESWLRSPEENRRLREQAERVRLQKVVK